MNHYENRIEMAAKMVLCIFLTMVCNLSVDSNIGLHNLWPDTIIPYFFFIFISFVIFQIDWKRLTAWIVKDKIWIKCICVVIFFVLTQCIALRIDLAENAIFFIKTGVKALVFGAELAIFFIMCIYKTVVRKKIPTVPFCLGCLAGILYFYLIRLKDSYSIYPFLLFMLLYLTEENAENGRREKISKGIGAFIFALFETLGYAALMYYDYHGNLLCWFGSVIAGACVWTFLFYYLLTVLFRILDKWIDADKREKKPLSSRKRCGILFAMMGVRFLFWLNWFPGLVSSDTYAQIQQTLGNAPYHNHHPFLHTMFIQLFMNIGKAVFGSNQAGVALVSFVSFILSSLLLFLALTYFYQKVPDYIWKPVLILYVLDPLHCIYAVTIWKDVLFAYALVGFCLLLMIMEQQFKIRGKIKPPMWMLYIAATFLFCFLRTNGLYAWLFSLPFIVWHYRKNWKPWIVSTLVCFLLIISYKGWLLPHMNVMQPDTVEALSVPLQQIAFTVRENGNFSEYDKYIITNIIDMESMGEVYDAHISDPVKHLIRENGNQGYITENKWDFVRMYISVGVKNPIEYIVSFLNQSRGYWHQKISNYLYYDIGVNENAKELGIYQNPLLPQGVHQKVIYLLDKYCDIWHLFWSLALTINTVILLIVYCIARKKDCFYFSPIIGVFLTLVIATPVNDEFRYAYGIYLVLPVMLLQISTKQKAKP